ncbi:hypothetical protein JCGZ_01615 [Jatropha curcas]|uniref:TIR domain-containing protein n=1 Tax=Jatropha curcas TaxID=180498 RepID=A0A067L1G0_JATCU|nr:hypothetical protein JCGZ_01615 [Jatropha curcas]
MGSSCSSSASTSSQRTPSFIINSIATSSPSSTSSQQTPSELNNYEVFINFRGKDIRDGFLSFLFESLKEKGIDTFKDENLQKGTEITPALKQTIQESYPTDVQELRGPFARALARLLKDHSDSSHNLGGWCHALKTISNDLSAFVSNEIKNDQLLVQRIVNRVSEILSHMPSNASYHDKLQRKKVLIVFDDVDDSHDLDLLAGNCSLYRKGSRIIITSTDRQVLRNVCHEEHIYRVEGLIDEEARQLLSLHAFHQNEAKEGYVELSEQVISYAQGNPLALKVLGSSLYGKEKEYWESQLLKLKSIPNKRIQDVLKISYDGLDRNEQSLFLDIACLFGEGYPDGDELEKIIECFGFLAKCGIWSLDDKSLITISGRQVKMHNLLKQMGKEIVNRGCKQAGKNNGKFWFLCELWNKESH